MTLQINIESRNLTVWPLASLSLRAKRKHLYNRIIKHTCPAIILTPTASSVTYVPKFSGRGFQAAWLCSYKTSFEDLRERFHSISLQRLKSNYKESRSILPQQCLLLHDPQCGRVNKAANTALFEEIIWKPRQSKAKQLCLVKGKW